MASSSVQADTSSCGAKVAHLVLPLPQVRHSPNTLPSLPSRAAVVLNCSNMLPEVLRAPSR